MLVGIDAAISDAASLKLMAEAMTWSRGGGDGSSGGGGGNGTNPQQQQQQQQQQSSVAKQKASPKEPTVLQYHFHPENTVVSRDSVSQS